MKITFLGIVDFLKKVLEKLIELDTKVLGVFTTEKSNFNRICADLNPYLKGN